MSEESEEPQEQEGTQLSLDLVPGEWALKKVFGPILNELGQDLSEAYKVGRDKILIAAYKKIRNPNDGKKENLRIAHEVLWNGGAANDQLCAEYFGGILAASRSEGRDDDSLVQFVEIIRSLSSRQLRLHYAIYKSLNDLWCADSTAVSEEEVSRSKIVFFAEDLVSFYRLKSKTPLDLSTELQGLKRLYLLDSAIRSTTTISGTTYAQWEIVPTQFGIILFAVAMNRVADWREFFGKPCGEIDGAPVPPLAHRDGTSMARHKLDNESPFLSCNIRLFTSVHENLVKIQENARDRWPSTFCSEVDFSFSKISQHGPYMNSDVSYSMTVEAVSKLPVPYTRWESCVAHCFQKPYVKVDFSFARQPIQAGTS